MEERLSRSKFLKVSSAAACVGPTSLLAPVEALANIRRPFRGNFCLFSKAVPQLTWQELARSARRLEGNNLPVRRRDVRLQGFLENCR
jgi:hypothetical protein